MSVFLFPGQGIVDERIFRKDSLYHEETISHLETLAGIEINASNYLDHAINSPLTVAHAIANYKSAQPLKNSADTIFAGYSVGHFAALSCAGFLNWKNCIDFVHKRAILMEKSRRNNLYTMVALIGPDKSLLEKIIDAIPSGPEFKAAITNYNSPINHTLAGSKKILQDILESIPKEKVVKVVWLDNLGAWHSPALSGLLNEYKTLIDSYPFTNSSHHIISNVTADEISSVEELKEDLLRHLVSPVRWHDMVSRLRENGHKEMYEFGEAAQLSKMIFFSFRDIRCRSFKDVKSCVE